MSNPDATDWEVTIETHGPGGIIHYTEGGHSARFFWEFGAGDVVAIISEPVPGGWDESYPWAAGRLGEVLQRVAQETIRQKAPHCTADVRETSGCVMIHEPGSSPPLGVDSRRY
jgi:hypothetical protein